MLNYFTAECPCCKAIQGGYTRGPRDQATLRCFRCGRGSKLATPDRSDGAYTWYFGRSYDQAQALIRKLKAER